MAGVIAPNGISSASSALEIFASYGRENFDLPDSPEVDGMLFQEGIRSFTGRPLFTVSFVRQFDRLDADGKHLEYYHVRIELLYEATEAFRSLPKRKLWWFREDAGSSDGLEGWVLEIRADPSWNVIERAIPLESSIRGEEV